ncbi:MAG: efflux RND transporter permease subunit [Candidatus Xenobia bacterium]
MTKDALVAEMTDKLQHSLPGIDFNFSQNIEDNVEEALSGVKGMNSLKVFGPDLDKLERLATQIYDVMKNVRGVEDLGVLHALGMPNLLISTDRQAAARYGLQVADVDGMVSAAIGGGAATQFLDGEKRFDVVVRLLPAYRKSIEAIRKIPIVSPDGEAIPLGDVTEIQSRSGAGYIYREDNTRFIPVKFSVRGRDLQSTVAEADARIRRQVKLPEGYYIVWSGEIEQLGEAMRRLRVIVPVTLLIILFILSKTFNNSIDGVLILGTVPLACIGGVWALYLRGMPFSVSAGVGFISLLGVCTLQDVVLVSRVKHHARMGLSTLDAVMAGAEQRLRPVLMVACTAAIGLLPMALSTSIGSETQRPLATVVVVGMLTSALVTLLIYPALLYLVYSHAGTGNLSGGTALAGPD